MSAESFEREWSLNPGTAPTLPNSQLVPELKGYKTKVSPYVFLQNLCSTERASKQLRVNVTIYQEKQSLHFTAMHSVGQTVVSL